MVCSKSWSKRNLARRGQKNHDNFMPKILRTPPICQGPTTELGLFISSANLRVERTGSRSIRLFYAFLTS